MWSASSRVLGPTRSECVINRLCGRTAATKFPHPRQYPRRNPESCGAGRDIRYNKRHGSDFGASGNVNIAQHLRVCAKLYVIVNCRHRTIHRMVTDRYSLAKRAITAYDCFGMYEYVPKMVDAQSRSDLSLRREADSGNCFHDVKHHPIGPKLNISCYSRLATKHTPSKAIDEDRPDRLLAEERPRRVTR